MKSAKRSTAALLAAAVMTISLIGCDDSSKTASPATAESKTATPAPATITAVAAAVVDVPAAPATAPASTDVKASPATAQATLDMAVTFLKSQQKPDGSWQNEKDPPAVTAIVLRALVKAKPDERKADFIKKGYDKLLSYQVEDGGIYKSLLANYNTAIAVSALAAAEEPAYQEKIDKAVAYLKGLQWTTETRPEYVSAPTEKEQEQNTGKQVVTDDKHPFFGGFGYGHRSAGGGGRPDLSNSQLAIEALKDAGLKENDPAFQNALKFVTRMQNHSETNDRPWAGDDGGFVYGSGSTGQGDSQAGDFTDSAGERRLRSYGSMTYAGLKSMIYAGLTKEDPRVKAAWSWISKNWVLDENPGMRLSKPEAAQQGLFYYYQTLAKALNAYNEPVITDAQGKTHDWRLELITTIAALQKPDGSFVGDKRWMEDNPVLVTSYVVIALQEALDDLKEHPAK